MTQDAAHNKVFCWTFLLYIPSRPLEQFRTQGFLRIESTAVYKGVLVREMNLRPDKKRWREPGRDEKFLSHTGFYAYGVPLNISVRCTRVDR